MNYFCPAMFLNILNLPSVPGTNKFLFDKIMKEEVAEGFVVVADEQTAGKGLGKNTWESEAGKNLTFSILLKPDFLEASEQFLITQIVSVSVVDVLKKYIHTNLLKVKWPNDIYVSDRKIAGILVQNIVKGRNISHSVVGVGLNVNQKEFVSDAPNPVSIIQLTNKVLDTKVLLGELLGELKLNYSRCKVLSEQLKLNETYLSNLYRLEQQHGFVDASGHFSGRIIGVNNFGQLKIQDGSGKVRVYSYKEVEFEISEPQKR
jgi:BirA family biotin operon repressor/biotin-[acetyl-CoA-carboxylase] ligase